MNYSILQYQFVCFQSMLLEFLLYFFSPDTVIMRWQPGSRTTDFCYAHRFTEADS